MYKCLKVALYFLSLGIVISGEIGLAQEKTPCSSLAFNEKNKIFETVGREVAQLVESSLTQIQEQGLPKSGQLSLMLTLQKELKNLAYSPPKTCQDLYRNQWGQKYIIPLAAAFSLNDQKELSLSKKCLHYTQDPEAFLDAFTHDFSEPEPPVGVPEALVLLNSICGKP